MKRVCLVVGSLWLWVGAFWCSGASDAQAQMIANEVGSQNLNSSHFEQNSIGWSLQGRNWFANFGGGVPAGGGGLTGGLGFFGGGASGRLGFQFAQGSQRSISSTSGSLTTLDGVPGSLQSGVIRPFVTGVTPVLGGYPTLTDPSQVAAHVGTQQLSNLRQSQAARQSKKLDEYLRRAQLAESEGNKRMARANYRGAIAIAPQPLRSQIELRLRQMMQRKP